MSTDTWYCPECGYGWTPPDTEDRTPPPVKCPKCNGKLLPRDSLSADIEEFRQSRQALADTIKAKLRPYINRLADILWRVHK